MTTTNDQLVDRERLLAEFDMLTNPALAVLCHVEPKTLLNRPLSKLPPFIKVGRERLYPKKGVLEWFAALAAAKPDISPTPYGRRPPIPGGPSRRRLGKAAKATKAKAKKPARPRPRTKTTSTTVTA